MVQNPGRTSTGYGGSVLGSTTTVADVIGYDI
jgi:hypothetical protein